MDIDVAPLAQYGALGVVVLYFLFRDWYRERQADKREEDRLNKSVEKEAAREKEVKEREDRMVDALTRMQAQLFDLQQRYSVSLERMVVETTKAINDSAQAMRANTAAQRDLHKINAEMLACLRSGATQINGRIDG